MDSENRITKFFNLMLFVYLLANLQIEVWLAPDTTETLPWDQIFQGLPSYVNLLALLTVGILLIIGGALLIKNFWNTFMSDIFKIREINTDEAIALSLIFSLLYS